MAFGDRSGNKRTVAVTHLEQAAQQGAVFMAQCYVDTISHHRGVVRGVAASVTTSDGRQVALTVRAKTVVVSPGLGGYG